MCNLLYVGYLIAELPAGKLVEFLVGFTNNGDKDFILDAIDASFRYPMDFNFYIQNFTAIPYNRAVKPRQEATVMYSFYPAEAFAARPLGLTVNLAYHDAVSNVLKFYFFIRQLCRVILRVCPSSLSAVLFNVLNFLYRVKLLCKGKQNVLVYRNESVAQQ